MLERLVLPRAKNTLVDWLNALQVLEGVRWLVPAHYSAPVAFTPERIQAFVHELLARDWAASGGDWDFLGSIDQQLLDLGVVPTDPLSAD